MPGSDALEAWRAGLLADGHRIPVIRARDGKVEEANGPALGFFVNLRVGMDVALLFEESCRQKLRNFLEKNVCGAVTELEVTQTDRPPVAARLLLLTTPGEQLLVTGAGGADYTEEIGSKLMAANAHLASLARELSRRMHQLDSARQTLQKLAELRELFIAALAHDLKNPLSVILLSESLLREETPPARAKEVNRHIDQVERSAKRMLHLIDALLFAAVLDSADSLSAEALEDVSLDEVAREAVHDVAPLANDAGVEIALTAPEVVRARGNRTWLTQVFVNLLTNAIRYSPRGARIDVAVLVEGSKARCEVVDRGPGVPAADRERIFDRFVQRGERRGSIGLGLHICRKILDLHGGQIWAEENPGGGARFIFRLPAICTHMLHQESQRARQRLP